MPCKVAVTIVAPVRATEVESLQHRLISWATTPPCTSRVLVLDGAADLTGIRRGNVSLFFLFFAWPCDNRQDGIDGGDEHNH